MKDVQKLFTMWWWVNLAHSLVIDSRNVLGLSVDQVKYHGDKHNNQNVGHLCIQRGVYRWAYLDISNSKSIISSLVSPSKDVTHLIQEIISLKNDPRINAHNQNAHKQFEEKMDADEQETRA